jgi:hypothetical protein
VKVDDQAQGHVEQLHVAEADGLVDGQNSFDRFDFDKEATTRKHVEPERLLELQALVLDLDLLLCHGRDASQLKLSGQALFVNAFQKAGTEYSMNLDCRSDYLSRQFISSGEMTMHETPGSVEANEQKVTKETKEEQTGRTLSRRLDGFYT